MMNDEKTNANSENNVLEELGVVYRIPITELKPHPQNPYRVKNDEKMQELSASIGKYGVLIPVIARKKDDGYELIAGHRRHFAAQQAGLDHIPVLVMDMDDDEAIIRLVDTNIQREDILPSERAWAYKLRMEAMKRTAGRPSKSRNDCEPTYSGGYRSDDEVGSLSGVSGDTIRNYISLTNLIPELMHMVDAKQISLTPAYILAALPKEDQLIVFDALEAEQVTPSVSQAQRIKKMSQVGGLTEDATMNIMREQKKPIKNDITLEGEKIRKYFPKTYTPAQIETVIFKLLDAWQRKKQRDQAR